MSVSPKILGNDTDNYVLFDDLSNKHSTFVKALKRKLGGINKLSKNEKPGTLIYNLCKNGISHRLMFLKSFINNLHSKSNIMHFSVFLPHFTPGRGVTAAFVTNYHSIVNTKVTYLG